MFSIYFAFAIYSLALIAIGTAFSYRSSTSSDYVSGHRSINYVVTAIATQASDMGSWLFMGLPAAVYVSGLPEAWTAIGLIIGMLCTWIFVAKKLRVESERLSASTLNQYLTKRHPNQYTKLVLFICATTSTFFFTIYILSGLVALGRLLEAAVGFSFEFGVIASVVITLIYTLLGGFVSVAWCDLFQGLFLLAMIVLVPAFALNSYGGISLIITRLHNLGVSTSLFGDGEFLTSLGLALGWGLGYFGQPHILSNFFGIDDAKKIKSATIVGITWQIIVFSTSVCTGLIGRAIYTNANFDPEFTFVQMALDNLSPMIAGFALCGIIAATLSSLDSLILVGGTTLAYDCYKSIFNPHLSGNKTKNLARICSIILASVAAGMAFTTTGTIYHLVNFAWAGLGATFGPVLLLSLYWNHTTGLGVCAGMLTGATTVLLWNFFGVPFLPLVPGFIIATTSVILMSLLDPKANQFFAKSHNSDI